MSATDWIRALWPIVISIIGVIVWLVRLESKQSSLKEDVMDAKMLSIAAVGKQEVMNEALRKELAIISRSQARIEGIISLIRGKLIGDQKDEEAS